MLPTKRANLLLFIGIASLITGLLLFGVSFLLTSPPSFPLSRVLGLFFLVEATAALWLVHKKRRCKGDQDKQSSALSPFVSVAPKQSWRWVWGPTLGIAALFGLGYWWQTGSKHEEASDWNRAYTLYQRKDYPYAEEKLRQYNEDWGDFYGAGHYYLGLCLEHEGKTDDARDAFQETMQRSRQKQKYWSHVSQTRYYNALRELKKLPPASVQ